MKLHSNSLTICDWGNGVAELLTDVSVQGGIHALKQSFLEKNVNQCVDRLDGLCCAREWLLLESQQKKTKNKNKKSNLIFDSTELLRQLLECLGCQLVQYSMNLFCQGIIQ